MKEDLVNHPHHYTAGRKYEPADVLDDWFPTNPLLWQVGRYISRAGRKTGEDAATTLRKARWYLDREIARVSATPASVTITADVPVAIGRAATPRPAPARAATRTRSRRRS